MLDYVEATDAQLRFIAATVLVSLSVLVLNYAWRSLKNTLSTLPEGEQRVRFNLRVLQREIDRDKALIILAHFIGCVCFGFSIAFSAFTISGVAAPLLGLELGPYQQANYEASKVTLFISVGFFLMGLWLICFTYIGSVISVITGKPNFLTTDARILPDWTADEIAKRRAIGNYILVFLLLAFLLSVPGIFQWWLILLASTVVVALMYLVTRLVRIIACAFKRFRAR